VPPKFPNVDVALKMHATKGSPQGECSDDGKGEIKKFPIPHQYLDPQKIFSILQQSKLGGVSGFENTCFSSIFHYFAKYRSLSLNYLMM
jgi:hypothetical protein